MSELWIHQKADLEEVRVKYAGRRDALKAGTLVKASSNKRAFYSLLKAERIKSIEAVKAVLLKKEDEIFVKELKESQYMKLKQVKRGDVITIDKQERVLTSGVKKGIR